VVAELLVLKSFSIAVHWCKITDMHWLFCHFVFYGIVKVGFRIPTPNWAGVFVFSEVRSGMSKSCVNLGSLQYTKFVKYLKLFCQMLLTFVRFCFVHILAPLSSQKSAEKFSSVLRRKSELAEE